MTRTQPHGTRPSPTLSPVAGCPVAPDLSGRAGDREHPGYADLLRLEELLSLQRADNAHDELLFVVIHQTHELWFKLLLFELESVRDRLVAGALPRACHGLRRLVEVVRLLTAHWAVLDTMLTVDYLAFRDTLQGGSGFESAQYREIEFLAGAQDPAFLERVNLSDTDRKRLHRRLVEPTVREAFNDLVHRRGLSSLAQVFRRDDADGADLDWELLDVAERLLDFDAGFARWRAHHCLAVERLIGHRPGTGGSAGVAYLRTRTELRLFPELWEVRSSL
jgi:tryptophan 2,3-dioxygenase